MMRTNIQILDWAIKYCPVWIPALVVLLIYIPVVENGFVWDDYKAFFQYPYYQHLSYLGRAFAEPLVFLSEYYRPLTSASFILQIHLLGLEPAHLHLASLVIHIINTCLVGLLALQLTGDMESRPQQLSIPLAATLFFGLHPALTESVAWISVRYDLLTTFFMLLAMLVDSRVSHRAARPVLVGLLFLLAALSKEMAVALALALPFWHLAKSGETSMRPTEILKHMHKRGDLTVYLAIFISGCLYLLIRYHALGYLVATTNKDAITGSSSVSHFLLIFRSYLEYLALMTMPFHQLGPAHPINLPLAADNIHNWLTVAGILLIPALALFLVTRRFHSGWLVFAILASLIPITNIAIIHRPAGSFFAESYLVFPIAILSLLLNSILKEMGNLKANNRKTILAGGLVIGIFWMAISAFTISATIPLWKNNILLWAWASKRYPDSTTSLNNLANELNQQEQYGEAAKAARQAISINDKVPAIWATLGTALAGLERYKEAEQALEKSIELHFENVETWVALANIKARQGNFTDAIEILEKIVLPNEPQHIGAMRALARIHQETGNLAEARKWYSRAIKLTASLDARNLLKRQLDTLTTGQ